MSTDSDNVEAPENESNELRSGAHLDVSFAYYFRGDCPDLHIKEALRNLLSNCVAGDAEEHLRKGYEQEVNRVRWLIATNPNTPPQVLDHLARKNDPSLLERIAENPRTSINTLRKLARDACPEVRAAVAENLNAPRDVVELLIQDESADVRYRLAESPNIGEDLLRVLCEDENPYVAHRAGRTLSKLMPPAQPVSGPFYTLPWKFQADV